MKTTIRAVYYFASLFFLLISGGESFSQSPKIEVELTLSQTPQVLFLNDLDLLRSGNSPLIFQVRILNLTGQDLNVVATFQIKSQALGLLAEGKTAPFVLPSGGLSFDNRNLFSSTEEYSLQEYSIEAAADELVQTILRTGKLPTDTYNFVLTVEEITQGPAPDRDTGEVSLIITNPTTLDLISPGEAVTSGGEVPEIFTTLPLFQWESDATEFRITVCEKLATNSSPEEVMTNEARVNALSSDPLFQPYFNGTSFQYPSSGVWPLEEGKTYYWQVKAIVQSAGSDVELQSEIWGFKVAYLTEGVLSAEQLQIIAYLRTILGDATMDALLAEGGELNEHTATGVILRNGMSIDLHELQAIIAKLLNGQAAVTGFTVE